jgi:hypothetical protein
MEQSLRKSSLANNHEKHPSFKTKKNDIKCHWMMYEPSISTASFITIDSTENVFMTLATLWVSVNELNLLFTMCAQSKKPCKPLSE